MKHRVIPIFLPMLACPHRCIYCNQFAISGHSSLPDKSTIINTIESYLQTIPDNFEKRIAFFGGSFTCLPINIQNNYLDMVQPYLESNKISGIQISTRPDYINESILQNLKNKRVTLIELGAQSLNDDVLIASNRGHSVRDVQLSSKLILDYGFELGLQMMIGLPLDTKTKSLETARLIKEFGAKYTRIYPTLVIDGTHLAKLYKTNQYEPLSIPDAVDWCKDLYLYFNSENINILRMGLHPTKDLTSGNNFLAGPFHVSFKELVLTAVWRDKIQDIINNSSSDKIEIKIPKSEINYAVGYNSANKIAFQNVKFIVDYEN